MNTIAILSGAENLGQSAGRVHYATMVRAGFAARRSAGIRNPTTIQPILTTEYGSKGPSEKYAPVFRGRRRPVIERSGSRTQAHGRFAIEAAKKLAREHAQKNWFQEATRIMAAKRQILQTPAPVSQREQITVLPAQTIGPPISARLSQEELAREVETIFRAKTPAQVRSDEFTAAKTARRTHAMKQRLGIRGIGRKATHRTLGIQGVFPWNR